MIKLIEEIVKAEEEAEKVVSDARSEATERKAAIEEELAAKLAAAREKAKADAGAAIEEARQRRSPDRNFKRGDDLRQYVAEHAESIAALVDELADYIMTTEFERA